MADVHGSPGDAAQMPAVPGAGPAPAPYTGPDQGAANVSYGVTAAVFRYPGVDVLSGVSGNAVQESGYAHDVSAGTVTPYYAGSVSPIQVHGDADAGGRDDVAGTVTGAVQNAEARYLEHAGDAAQAGPSHIGDLMALPDLTATGAPLDPGAAPGITDPSGGYYDPPRSY